MKFLLLVVAVLTAQTTFGFTLIDTIGANEEFVPEFAVWWGSDIGNGGDEYFVVYQPIRNPLSVPIRLTEWVEWRGVAYYENSYPNYEHRISISSSFAAVRASPRLGDLYNGVTSYTAWQSENMVDIGGTPINRVTHDLRENDIVIAPFTTVWGSIFTFRPTGIQVTGKLESNMSVNDPQHVMFFNGGYMFLANSFEKEYSGATLDRVSAEVVPESSTLLVFSGGVGILLVRRSRFLRRVSQG